MCFYPFVLGTCERGCVDSFIFLCPKVFWCMNHTHPEYSVDVGDVVLKSELFSNAENDKISNMKWMFTNTKFFFRSFFSF